MSWLKIYLVAAAATIKTIKEKVLAVPTLSGFLKFYLWYLQISGLFFLWLCLDLFHYFLIVVEVINIWNYHNSFRLVKEKSAVAYVFQHASKIHFGYIIIAYLEQNYSVL